MIATTLITTKSALARAIGCAEPTIHRWTRKEGWPGGVQGPWDVAACVAFMQARSQSTNEAGREPIQRITDTSKALKLREEVRRLKLKNDLLESRLMDRERTERQVAEIVVMIRTRMEAMPDEMEMTFPAETRSQNKADFTAYIRNVLKLMSQWRLET